MSDLGATLRTLLVGLAQAGANREASALHSEFEARSWNVGAPDFARVLAALEQAASSAAPDSMVALSAAQQPPANVSAVPEHWSIFAEFAPWVETIPAGWAFLDDLDGVFSARNVDDLARAVGRLFVERLGYEEKRLDATSRLGGQTTLGRVLTVAAHDEFSVVAVDSNFGGVFTTAIEPVFRLYPYCIVFELAWTGRVRVVVRKHSGGDRASISSRVLRGRTAKPEDDLLVWARRIARLEPKADDDARGLVERAHRFVELEGLEVAGDWPSKPVDLRAIPGPTWEESAPRQRERFLQPHAEIRVYTGLEAALRSGFPWRKHATSVDSATFELLYVSYRVEGQLRGSAEAIARGADHVVDVLLALEMRISNGSSPDDALSFSVEVPASVMIPDDGGRLVLRGRRAVFEPTFVSAAVSIADEQEDEPPAEEPADSLEGDLDELLDEPDSAGSSRFRGVSLEALLSHAVLRKLSALSFQFAKTPGDQLRTPEHVRALLLRSASANGRVELAARSVLAQHVRGESQDLHSIAASAESPPAWACLDVTSRLSSGRAYPIHGARIGPGGTLASPRDVGDGTAILSGGDGNALETNPRLERRAGSHLTPWIASGLTPWAHSPVGALEDPIGFLEHRRLEGRVLRVRGEHAILRIANTQLPKKLTTRTWSFDVPRHPASAEPPKLLISEGMTVESGAPILMVAPPTWTGLPESAEHRFRFVAGCLRTTERGEARGPLVVRCPPGVAGLVQRISVEPCTDRQGTVLTYRTTLVTCVRVNFDSCMMRDGRVVEVVDAASSEMPYRHEDGEPCVGVFEDPLFDLSGWPDEHWMDGATGDALEACETLEGVELRVATSAMPADIGLRYRIVDGLGEPRSVWDPALDVRELRLLRAGAPEAAARLDASMARVVPFAPQARTLFELALATHVLPPPVCPTEWVDASPSSNVAGEHDPMRSNIWRRRTKGPGCPSPFRWSCECGQLVGSQRAYESCAACRTRTEPRQSAGPLGEWPALFLAAPVFHPWRRDVTAALLGLARDELDSVLRAHDGSALAGAVENACGNPERSLIKRVRRTDDPKLAASLARGFEHLESVTSGRVGPADICLTELRLLPERLRFDGYPFGAPNLVSCELTERYRAVQSAAEHLAIAGPGRIFALRKSAWIGLQRAVDDLFGRMDAPSEGTLAELWTRAFPTTTPSHVRFAVPGLYERCEEDDALVNGVGLALGNLDSPNEANRAKRASGHRGVVTATGLHEVAALPAVRPRPSVSTFWRERAASKWFSDQSLVRFAAVLLGMDAMPSAAAHVDALRPHELDGEPLGPFVLREWVLGMLHEDARPSELRKLLDGARSIVLPADSDTALLRVEERLRGALPSDAPGAALARGTLARILSAFFHGTPSSECPSGWMFDPFGRLAPDAYRRTVPRLSDAAWRAWPGYRALTNPLEAAAAADWRGLTRAQRAWIGQGSYVPPPRWWTNEDAPLAVTPPEVPRAVDDDVPAALDAAATDVLPPPAFELNIRVLEESLTDWLLHQRRESDDAR